MTFVDMVLAKLHKGYKKAIRILEKQSTYPEILFGVYTALFTFVSLMCIYPDTVNNVSVFWLKLIFAYSSFSVAITAILNLDKPFVYVQEKFATIAAYTIALLGWLLYANVASVITSILF